MEPMGRPYILKLDRQTLKPLLSEARLGTGLDGLDTSITRA